MGPVLVIAGPGAGKTFCLVERVRFLIERRAMAPARICAFTYTNKAAQEMIDRLAADGAAPGASAITCSTVHAFCSKVIREFGERAGLPRGIGIADDDYQLAILSRIGVPWRQRRDMLSQFSRHRFRGEPLGMDAARHLPRYERLLERRRLLDFDQLLQRAAGAMEKPEVRDAVRERFDYVLVDEFQDLNPVAFEFVRRLASDGEDLYVVGDDEQSIYAWNGADPRVFMAFLNQYPKATILHLAENRRCPAQVMEPARRLIGNNRRIFESPKEVVAPRQSPHRIEVVQFDDGDEEASWLLREVQRVRTKEQRPWGDLALLYRTNAMGSVLESAFLAAGVPCQMAAGRALADHPVVTYLLAALRVIANPGDRIREAAYYRAVLPAPLYAEVERRADARDKDFFRWLPEVARERNGTDDARHLTRARVELANLLALGERHAQLAGLVHEILSQRVGQYRSTLDEIIDELSDPLDSPEVCALAKDLEHALVSARPVALDPMGGLEVAVRAMFQAAQLSRLMVDRPHPQGPLRIGADTVPSLGVALGTFKALQLVVTAGYDDVFADFVALDFEATGKDPRVDRVTEIGAIRVRSGKIVATWQTLVNPGVPIPLIVTQKTGISDEMVAQYAPFAEVWPTLRDFLGTDLVVAHNGHTFDFRLLRAELARLGIEHEVRGYDTLPLAREVHSGSRSLPDLAHAFGIDTGTSHRALDDTRTLALVVPELMSRKRSRARKTALGGAIEALALGLALTREGCPEADVVLERIRMFPLFRHARILDAYQDARARDGTDTWATIDAVVAACGGQRLREELQRPRDADDRYPELMARLRRVMDGLTSAAKLGDQVGVFLETIVLSQHDGAARDPHRVNLLTLHSTKGLEFPHVYIVGASNNDLLLGKAERWTPDEVEEARRLLYVGMTRTEEKLVLTVASRRGEKVCEDLGFIGELGIDMTKGVSSEPGVTDPSGP